MVSVSRFVSSDVHHCNIQLSLLQKTLETKLPNICGGQAYHVKTVHNCRQRCYGLTCRRVIDGVLMSYTFLLTAGAIWTSKALRTLQWKVHKDWVCSAGCRPGG